MGVVEEKKAKHRILHDMTFAGSKNKGGSGPVMAEWSNVPSGELSEVRTDIMKGILGLRAKFGRSRTIFIQKMDVKSASRQFVVNPAEAAAFACVVDSYVVADTRMPFG